MEIIEALKKMNPVQDDQWTADGLPRLDFLKSVTGGANIDRSKIQEVAPDFCRDNPFLESDSDSGISSDDEISGDDSEKETIDSLKEKLAALVQGRARLKAEIVDVESKLDELIRIYELKNPPMTYTQQMQAYQKTQKKLAMEKAKRRGLLEEKGFDLEELKDLASQGK